MSPFESLVGRRAARFGREGLRRRNDAHAVDRSLLAWLERERLAIAGDVLAHHARRGPLDEAVDALSTRLVSRLLFARICEERGLVTAGRTLRDLRDEADDETDLHGALARHLARTEAAF